MTVGQFIETCRHAKLMKRASKLKLALLPGARSFECLFFYESQSLTCSYLYFMTRDIGLGSCKTQSRPKPCHQAAGSATPQYRLCQDGTVPYYVRKELFLLPSSSMISISSRKQSVVLFPQTHKMEWRFAKSINTKNNTTLEKFFA